jgi:predicted transposase YdaD
MLEETFREWEQKMRREGRREGRQEGQVEGMQKMVLQTLRQRFGPVPQDVRRRVREISSSTELTRLHRRALTAKSLQETDLF